MSTTPALQVPLTVRDLELDDVADLEWSGSQAHMTTIATSIARAFDGETRMLGVARPGGMLIACGGLDLTRHPGQGFLWMLSVHQAWQSLGVGTVLITALEDAARAENLDQVGLTVEHDNPRAVALYRRLGYEGHHSVLDEWPSAGGRTYVTTCLHLVKPMS
ncbi:GNAT family N-acetyltransferase [Propionibacteriaceae bacterium Y1685]